MHRNVRRAIEALLILGILGVGFFLVQHLFRWNRVREMSQPFQYHQPNLKNVVMTIPGRPHNIPHYLQDPQSIKKRKTFTFSTNSRGYRGPEFTTEKPPGTFRVIAVGECVTFGNGVDDDRIWTHLLQKALAERLPSLRVEVINAGQSEPPGQIYRTFQEAANWNPDVMLFSPGTESVFLQEHLTVGRSQVWLEKERYDRSMGQYHNYLNQAADLARSRGFRLAFITPTLNTFFLPDGMLYVDAVRQVARTREVPLVETTALFRKMEAENGLVLETSPEGVQRLISYKDGKPTIRLEVKWNDPSWHVSPEVYQYLDKHPDVEPLLSIDENHPNERGHEVIAAEVLRVMEQAGFLPER